VLTRPLALGADIVMHSATKYLTATRCPRARSSPARADEFWQRIVAVRSNLGRRARLARGLPLAARHADA